MAIGPGRYDDITTIVRELTRARGVIVIVFDGDHGNGFSIQATTDMVARVPALLRNIADQIEADSQPRRN